MFMQLRAECKVYVFIFVQRLVTWDNDVFKLHHCSNTT